MKLIRAVVIFISSVFVLQSQLALAASNVVELGVEAEFADISIDIENANANQGFVLDYNAFCSEIAQQSGAMSTSAIVKWTESHLPPIA